MLSVSQGVCVSVEHSGRPGEGWHGRGENSSAGGTDAVQAALCGGGGGGGGLWWRCLDKDCLLYGC